MLQPKRTKFRKAFKAASTRSQGRDGPQLQLARPKAVEPERITARQIEAARRAITRHMKRAGRVWIRIFGHGDQRSRRGAHGLGQGQPGAVRCARVKPGRIMFELDGVSDQIARERSSSAPPSCRSRPAS